MVRWMGTEATLDPRPGGVCRINPSGHEAMLGEYVEVATGTDAGVDPWRTLETALRDLRTVGVSLNPAPRIL